MNTFGQLLRLNSWGESHGPAIGGVIDGFPSGFRIDMEQLLLEVARRAPNKSAYTSQRQEVDAVELLSGIREGVTLGSPIAFLIRNIDPRSEDYDEVARSYRPGHADYTYQSKYGLRDPRGGGRASARETATRVVAGALARQWLQAQGVSIRAFASQVGNTRDTRNPSSYSWAEIEQGRSTLLRHPDAALAEGMLQEIEAAHRDGDSIGGVITCITAGLPTGLGEPIYDKLSARLASAMLSINASRGFEIGEGFQAAAMRGSEHNDPMKRRPDGSTYFLSNHAGGVLGGISTGQELTMRIAFKPTPSIALPQETVDEEGQEQRIAIRGRHDPCVIPRALSVVEAMCALVLMDFYLIARAYTKS